MNALFRLAAAAFAAIIGVVAIGWPAIAGHLACRRACEGQPGVTVGGGELTAAYVSELSGGVRIATGTATGPQLYAWRLRSACEVSDEKLGGCLSTVQECPLIPGRLIGFYIVERRAIVQPDGLTPIGEAAPPGAQPGDQIGIWVADGRNCVDVTDLNPAPTPDEIFRYFKTLPLPALTTQQQPPGNGLVGLPVIFFTTSPTTRDFTVDIRGFTVAIAATATGFTWHTGDGATLTSTDPGAPYPHQTVTHAYRSGTWTARLTTTWSATYTVDAGPRLTVPGTTTTDGPPDTFTVLQAHTVLTNPYD